MPAIPSPQVNLSNMLNVHLFFIYIFAKWVFFFVCTHFNLCIEESVEYLILLLLPPPCPENFVFEIHQGR